MSNIIWQDPPAGRSKNRSSEIQAVIAELKTSPGSWALVSPDTTVGAQVTWQKYGCETRLSTIGKPKGKCDIYARWPEGEPAS